METDSPIDLLGRPSKIPVMFRMLLSSLVGISVLSAGQWERIGPGYKESEGITYNVLPHPENPEELLIGVRPQGMFLTEDGGGKWKLTSSPFNVSGGDGPNQDSVGRAPSNPDIVYAGLELKGVWRSDDGGRSWKDVAGKLPKGRARNGVSVAVHPQDPECVWLGTDGGIFKSTDGGKTWQRKTEGLPSGKAKDNNDVNQTISKILLDPQDPKRLLIGIYATGTGEPAGVWRSTDGGESWKALSRGIETGGVEDSPVWIQQDWILEMAQSEDALNALLIATPTKVYHSRDQGENWQEIVGEQAVAVAVHPGDGNHYFIALPDGGVKESSDAGRTWKDLSEGLPRGKTANAKPLKIEFTDSNGKKHIVDGMDKRFTHEVNSFAFDPKDPTVIYAAAHAGVYRLKL